MSSVTEIATLFLKAGTDVEDQSSPVSQIAQEAISTISNQPGCQRIYYGPELEDSSILQLFIDWDSIDSHKQFMASPVYGAFMKTIGTILTKTPSLYHFAPKPSPPTILSTAPIIEIATFFQTEDTFLSNVEKFVTTASPHMEGYLGHAYGPVIEEIEKEEGAGKGKAVVLCIGWESREKHMTFRETETFRENIHLLREGMKGSEMHHVALKSL